MYRAGREIIEETVLQRMGAESASNYDTPIRNSVRLVLVGLILALVFAIKDFSDMVLNTPHPLPVGLSWAHVLTRAASAGEFGWRSGELLHGIHPAAAIAHPRRG